MTVISGIDLERLREEARRDGMTRLVVGAVIHTAFGEVLILRRASTDAFLPGIEELPSGGVEPGEDLLTALRRELAEEIGRTGLAALDSGFVATFDYASASGHRTRQFTFGLPHDDEPIRLSPEHTGYRWIDLADLATADVTPETAHTIRAWAGPLHTYSSPLHNHR